MPDYVHRPITVATPTDRGRVATGSRGHDTESEHTQPDHVPMGVALPYQDASLAHAVPSEHTSTDTDELTFDDLRSLVESVEPLDSAESISRVSTQPSMRRILQPAGRAQPIARSDAAGARATPLASGSPGRRGARRPVAPDEDLEHTVPRRERTPPLPLPAPPSRSAPDLTPHQARSPRFPTTQKDFSESFDDVTEEQSPEAATDPMAPLRVPVIGGRYRIVKRIGAGGMGKVFKVTHSRLGKTFALKIITDALAGQNKARELFYREARMASSLSHPNIASVVDFGEDEAVGAFMVMEFLHGEPLSARLERDTRLGVRQAAEIIRQVAEALDYIHNKGIIHCDIKTENILLTEVPGAQRNKLQVKLLDFGLARSTDAVHNTARVAGTPHYVAPERLRGDQASPASDIYGVGILFYELITGRVPWEGTVDQILTGHLEFRPRRPSRLIDGGVDPAVDQLILRALAKEPAERHKTMAAFLYELHAVMDMLGEGRRKRPARRLVAERSSQRTLAQRDRTARSLFDASRIPMALINRGGVILVANPAFARFIMGVAVDVEGLQVQTTTLAGAWASFEQDLARACEGKSVRRTIKVDVEPGQARRLVMWLDPGLTDDQAIFGVHPLTA